MRLRPRIVDDHLLLTHLLDGAIAGNDGMYTTGLWYHRLARALADDQVRGTMTRLMDNDPGNALGATAALTQLPDDVGLVSMRELAWPMAALVADGARLNLLALEALAAAIHLEADLHLSERGRNPALEAAASERGVRVELVAL